MIIPLVIWKTTELQITTLASNERQILVIQDRGQTILINSGNESIARFTIVPFLQQQAINRVDSAIDFNLDAPALNSWQTLAQMVSIDKFYQIGGNSYPSETLKFEPLLLGKTQKFDRIEITTIKTNPVIFQIAIPAASQKWLVIGNDTGDLTQSAIDLEQLTPSSTLYWSGGRLTERSIAKIHPQVAIAATANPDPETLKLLEKNQVRVYYTGRDGAIQWTPSGQFKPYLEGEKS